MTISDTINTALKVRECKTMCFGLTMMDTDPASGREVNITDIKHQHVWSPTNALMLYPVADDYEKNRADKTKPDLSMACCWMTGLTPMRHGQPAPAMMTQNTRNWLSGRSVITTDQFFKSRPDDALAAMFSNFAWYGTKRRLVDIKEADAESLGKMVAKGIVSKSWEKNPVSVRYVVQVVPDTDGVTDYIYFVGGSDDVIGDNIGDIPKNISSWYGQIKSLKEEAKKSTKKKSQDEVPEHVGADPKFVWFAYTGSNSDPTVKANLLAKKIVRTVESIIFIYNYFYFAKNNIGISTVNEVVGFDETKGTPIYKVHEIDKILEKYDTMYAYCKNLCYIFKDIGAGDIM